MSAAAVEAAEQAGDEAALAAALCARRVVVAGPDSLTARAELADALLGSARRGRDADVELTGWLVAADAAFERGDLGRVEVCAAAAERSAASLGGPTARFQVLHTRAALAQARGEFTDARALTDEAFRLMEVTDQPARFHTRAGVLGFIGRHQGTGLAVISNENNVTSSGASREPIVLLAAAHALVCDGQLVSARALRATLGPPSQWRVPPHVQLLCWSLGIAVDTALGDRTTLVALIEALTPYRDHHAVSGMSAVAYFGPVRLWLGVAERHLERFPAAVDHLTAAHEACVRAGAAAFGVEAQTELAAVLVARGVSGDTGRADALLAEAATEADRLGMTRYAPVVAALRRQLSGSGTVLTPREIDVARLVARGMTNRQIAARLTLSERTAQNHVQHILTKLQLSNRSQIAVWLTRMSNGS